MLRLRYFCAAVVLVFLSVSLAKAATVNVSTYQQLFDAIRYAAPGDVIVVALGDYHSNGGNLNVTTANVTIRGATGNRDDVVIHGDGMNVKTGSLEGIWAAADGVQIRDLTVKDYYYHGIHVSDNPAGDLADNVVVSNVKIQNCGERYIKGSGNGISNNVLIQNSYFLQTDTYLPRPDNAVDPNDYIGGIDVMHTNNWTIRDNRFEGIKGATGHGRGAIFMWNGGTNNTIERNQIVNCAQGIDLGNGSNPGGVYHAENAIVRNNFVAWGGLDNRAIELGYTKNCKVYNNTVYSSDNYNRLVHIYDSVAVPTIGLELENNLIRGAILDPNGDATLINNITGATPQANWFTDAAAGDFHLTSLATAAIDHGLALALVSDDYDKQTRPMGLAYDIGADEFIPEPASLTLLALGAVGLLRRRRH